ncbi:MAG: glycosyltransferase family 4 protein [Rhodospirillaceae bacterium]|nr:glycosyltransferase family 4 protein [Rhodospirillaceae bacterium]
MVASMMRITIVQGPYFPIPPIKGGAVEKVFFDLGRAWAAAGHQVVHISRSHPDLPDTENIEGVHHIRIASRDAPDSRLGFRLHEWLYSLRARAALPKSDVTVTNGLFLPLVLPKRRAGQIYVHAARFPKGQMWLYRNADAIQTPSRPIAEAISRQTPSVAGLLRVIPYPVTEGFDKMPESALSDTRDKTVLYVGRLHPEKGLETLIHAFSALRDTVLTGWRLRIVGPHASDAGGGGEDYLAKLRELAAPLDEACRIEAPIYQQEDLAACYRQASLFVYPSVAETGETFGLAALEAMAMGCITVVSKLDCFQDFLTDGETGIVFDHRARDPATALAAALQKALPHVQSDAKLRQAAWQVAQDHSIATIADRFLADFASLTDASRP